MNRPIVHLVLMQFRTFFREPGILFWAFGFPIAMAWVLGIAFSGQGSLEDKAGVIVPAKNEQTILGERLRHIESGDGAYTLFPDGKKGHSIRLTPMDKDSADLALRRGKILFVLEETKGQGIVFHLDPANRAAHHAALQVEKHLFTDGRPGIRASIVPVTAGGSRYIDFLIPGLLALGVMNSSLWGTGWAITELRIKKLLRGMIATPMSRAEFLGSFFITRLLISLVEAVVLIAFARLVFSVKIQGSVPALLCLHFAGNAAFSGIAVFASSRAQSTQVANGIINALTLPMMVVSGIFFSYHNFPDIAIPVIERLPLTLFADSLRLVFNEGAGVLQILPASVGLAVVGLVFFLTGLRIYKWY